MQVSVETSGSLEKRLRITVPAAEVETALSSRLRNLASSTKIPGFRPGKVPMKLIEQRFGGQALMDTYDDIINRTYPKAVSEQGFRPVDRPSINVETGGRGQDFSFLATFEVFPEFEPNLGDEEIERLRADITDADVDRTLQILQEQRRTFETVDRPAEMGDQVIIDFKGFINDEPFAGGEAQGFGLILGSGRTIEGFESGLIGAAAGETRQVEVTFPEDYGNTELAGKQARFDITVQAVLAPKLPDIDSDFARSLGVEDGSVETLRSEVRENLAYEAERASRTRAKSTVLDLLVRTNENVDLPKALLDAEEQRLRQSNRPQSGEDEAEAEQKRLELARQRVRLGLVISEIVRRNDLRVDNDAVRQEIERVASQYQDPSQVMAWYLQNPERLAEIESMVLEDLVVDWVLTHAKTKEQTVSFNQLIGRPETA